MQSLQARIDSFHKTRRVKRYPNKSSSTSASVKWPHSADFKANANTLAEAGFFFSPSWDDRDSVACFLCGKELSDWDQDDDPFDVHYTKCQGSCAWALVRCGLTEDLDSKGRFVFDNKMRLPSSKEMERARLQTFGKDWWPHDGEPGHGATSAKMAHAGFVYTPQTAGDDTVTCLYCNLSLGGWEKQDDPFQEHRTRDSKSGTACPFLVLLPPKQGRTKPVELSTEPPPPRSKRGRGRSTTSTASSKSRRKTKATRGKSIKASAQTPPRSPSPNQTVSNERDEADMIDGPSSDVNVPRVPTDTEPLVNGSTHSLPNEPISPPRPGAPNILDNPPVISPNRPDPVISLSPAGQPIIANSDILGQDERVMSLEQWIRQEIDLSYERFLAEGRSQIDLFKTKAAELRKCIDEL